MLSAFSGGEVDMNKKGHFTGETFLVSVLAAALAYLIVEKVIGRSRERKGYGQKDDLRIRK